MELYKNDSLQPICSYCSIQLSEPYIECAECDDINVCTNCFSKGAEILQHKNDHKYVVRKNDFPLFENCNWSAKDEYNLLKYIGEHGYGNWDEIAKSMQTHSKLECQEHYKKFYIENTQDYFPNLFPNDGQIHELYQMPFLLRQSNIDEPPRSLNSLASQQLAGYNAYRSDFEMNFDNNAESVLSFETINEDDEDAELMKSLQCSLVVAYNNRLRERMRRYKVIRDHGLICVRKFSSWIQNYEETLGRQTCEKLAVFMQLVSGPQFDIFVENLSMEKELELRIQRLYELRKNGIKTFKGAYLYQNLKRKEEKIYKELKSFQASEFDWKDLSTNTSGWKQPLGKDGSAWKNQPSNIKANPSRKSSTPLEIVGLPGYEKLSEKEKELCSTVRLVPVNFIEFRNILVCENNKNGCLRLLDARRLIKIDVNKTRKLYDYLLSEGFINKPF